MTRVHTSAAIGSAQHWPTGRIVAWLAGCLLLLVVTSSGLGRYAETQFSLHMTAHMLLGIVAPALLVLGGPVTLALRVLTPAGRTRLPGLRGAILAALHSRPARLITHPLVVLPLFIGSSPPCTSPGCSVCWSPPTSGTW